MSTDVYAAGQAMIRERLLARPQARGRGKSAAFIDRGGRLGEWFLRKHGPYGPRIFSGCREVLRKLLGFCCRALLKAFEQIGLIRLIGEKRRKHRSPEYAAFQFELGPEFALLFSAAPSETRQIGESRKVDQTGLPISGVLVPVRTWHPRRPEFRLTIKRAASATLEALQRLPLPALSPGALATLRRPAGFYR